MIHDVKSFSFYLPFFTLRFFIYFFKSLIYFISNEYAYTYPQILYYGLTRSRIIDRIQHSYAHFDTSVRKHSMCAWILSFGNSIHSVLKLASYDPWFISSNLLKSKKSNRQMKTTDRQALMLMFNFKGGIHSLFLFLNRLK